MENLYFVAIVPPADISGQISAMKKQMRDHFETSHALRSPPHITLHMPFKWKEAKQDQLHQALSLAACEIRSFEVNLEGFGAFEPRVIYVNVTTTQSLEDCQIRVKKAMRSLNVLNADYKQKAFHPHVTIGFRDLKKSNFYKAWDEYKRRDYSAGFRAQSFVLLKHEHKEGQTTKWNVCREFSFSI
jgi:2'-5' RNA ligase